MADVPLRAWEAARGRSSGGVCGRRGVPLSAAGDPGAGLGVTEGCATPPPPKKPSAGLGTYWDFFFFLGGKTSLCWLGMGNEWGGTLHP